MSCCDQSGLLPVDEAIARLLASVQPVTEIEWLPLSDALGCVLAQDQISTIDVPPADNSAMDGYALRIEDISRKRVTRLAISQRIPAGVSPGALAAGTVARIFTGAEIPEGANAVVMQERCQSLENDSLAELPADIPLQDNIRPQGQDIAKGSCVLSVGRRLQAQDLGVLASIGTAKVPVYRRLKIAVLSTGDELIEPGTDCQPGQIYNSNRYTLAGLIDALGMERLDFGIVPDDASATERALLDAAEQADCVITSGGVSVGEEDHVKACVEKLGCLDLWKLAIKPGKPLAFGRIKDTPFFGLPGNPAAVFVTFAIIARPYLLCYQGLQESLEPTLLPLKANFVRSKAGKRQEYLRARMELSENGELQASLHSNQSSGVLSAATWANGFVVQPIGETIAEGDRVGFISFSEMF